MKEMKIRKYKSECWEPTTFDEKKHELHKLLHLVCPMCDILLDVLYAYHEEVSQEDLFNEFVEMNGVANSEDQNVKDTVIHMMATKRENVENEFLGKAVIQTFLNHHCESR